MCTLSLQNEQVDTIRNFRQGTLNLLISTSVAEEGLDIPECNLVVRYGLLTNEIAQQQASGRARAANSTYSVVAQKGGREERRELTNEYLEELTGTAIAKVQDMNVEVFSSKVRVQYSIFIPYAHCLVFPPSPFLLLCLQITQLQRETVTRRKVEESLKTEKRTRNTAASIKLLCRNCFKHVASGSDIKVIDSVHHVNVNPDFK